MAASNSSAVKLAFAVNLDCSLSLRVMLLYIWFLSAVLSAPSSLFLNHCVIRCPVIRREAALIAHAWSMQSIIKVSWIVGFIKIGHQIRDPRWRKPLGTYPGPRWMSPPP